MTQSCIEPLFDEKATNLSCLPGVFRVDFKFTREYPSLAKRGDDGRIRVLIRMNDSGMGLETYDVKQLVDHTSGTYECVVRLKWEPNHNR